MPWVVEAAPGQQIRFTLHDFSAQQRHGQQPQPGGPSVGGGRSGGSAASDKGTASSLSGPYCVTYAVLREPPAVGSTSDGLSAGSAVAPKRYTVCGRRERRWVAYRSSGNVVEVRIMKHAQHSAKSSVTSSADDNDDDKSYFLLEYEGSETEMFIMRKRILHWRSLIFNLT
jgi:hypothetical protein